MPIMDSKFPLLDEPVKRVNHNLQLDNTEIDDDNDDSSNEDEFDDEVPI